MNFGPDRIVKGWEMTAAGYTGCVGDRQHARGAVGRNDAPRDLRDERAAHDRPVLRRLRLHRGRRWHARRRWPATPRACRWGAICPRHPPARRRRFSSPRSRTDSAATSIASRSSKDGWARTASRRRRSTTWSGATRTGARSSTASWPPVGNTVDVATATFTNSIGDPELVTVWTDPDFDPSTRAVYYARVLEIPTPRWTAYDAAYFKFKITDPKVPMTTQERAFTSPIWYSPK